MIAADAPNAAAGPAAPAPTRGSRRWWIFAAVSAVVFVALAVSIAHQLSRPYLDARYIDPASTRLLTDDDGQVFLVVGLRDVSRPEAIQHTIRTDHPEIGGVVVEIRTRATTRPDHRGGREVYALKVPVPPAEQVTVLDLRWARNEGLVVRREHTP